MTRKMKDSGIEWIGEIPEEWEVRRLKGLLLGTMQYGANESGDVFSEDYPRYIRITDIVSETKLKEEGKLSLSTEKASSFILDDGDILFARSGATVGKTFMYTNKFGVCAFAGYLIRAKLNTKMISKYLLYYTMCSAYEEWKNRIFIQATIQNIGANKYSNMELPVPLIAEQKRITYYLDNKCSKIDETIQKEKQVIEKLKQYKQSVITEAVTKGLDSDLKMKDSGIEWIGEIPEHWSISRFSFETWVRARLGWKGLKADEYVQDGYILLATPNIKNKDIDFVNVNYIDEFRYEESPEIKLSIGDVLLTKDGSTLGTVNVVRYLPKGATVNSSIAVITPGSNLDGIFLMYQIKGDYIKKIIENKKDGMGVPHLFQKDINKIYITLPPIEEQKQIAIYLDKKCASIDKAISNKEKLIEKLTEYKKSLIYECVTGKREV